MGIVPSKEANELGLSCSRICGPLQRYLADVRFASLARRRRKPNFGQIDWNRLVKAFPGVIALGLAGDMDGFAVARACRAEESLRSVRLVATSGYRAAEDHANARTAGFDLLMVKPLTEESLREIVH